MNKYLDIIQATRQHTDQLFVQWAGALVSGTGRSGVIRSVKDHNHKTEDMYAVAYISVWFFVATWLVRKLTIEPLARYYLPRVTGDKRKLESRTAKFGQSAMEGLTYAAFSYFGYVIVLQQEWFLPADRWFGDLHDNSLPDSQESHYNIDTALTFYVLSYLGRYFAAVLSLFLEAKRKDFWQMFVHHVSTCFLVWTCYFKPYVRIGAVIMVLLDPADVPLHVAKLLKYMSSDSKGKTINIPTNNVCDASFGIFAIVRTHADRLLPVRGVQSQHGMGLRTAPEGGGHRNRPFVRFVRLASVLVLFDFKDGDQSPVWWGSGRQ